MEAVANKYSINTSRELFIFGDEHYFSLISLQLKGYYFLNIRSGQDYSGFRKNMHFMLGAVDFTNSIKVQKIARKFAEFTSPVVHKLLYAAAPNVLTQEHLLFAREIGCRFVFSGATKNDDFKEYLKRVCLESSQNGSLAELEEEWVRSRAAGNKTLMQKVIEKIKNLPRESEESNRLLAIAHIDLYDFKKSEIYLRKLLKINPQNLWAANTLAKQYLRSGRAALGIEIMQKLSQFHDINSDRQLTLGRALLIAGDDRAAQVQFEKGAASVGGQDSRFGDGLAMVKVVQGDVKAASTFLDSKNLSQEVISFLNLKAIMASKQNNFSESIRYYDFASAGAGTDSELQAKLKFNMALAYVRMNNLAKAQTFFQESMKLGGKKFQRAKGPLEVVSNIMAKKSNLTDTSRREILGANEVEEWETVF
jgi:tetratricopeptide (TPR) repeat protein